MDIASAKVALYDFVHLVFEKTASGFIRGQTAEYSCLAPLFGQYGPVVLEICRLSPVLHGVL